MTNNPSASIYSIYCITNLVNHKKYVGFTSKFIVEERFKQHCRYNIDNPTTISKAIQKYGKDNFKFEVILQGLDRDNVLSMETHFINECNTLSPNGYNLTTGGQAYELSEESRNKTKNENHYMFGKKHSVETKLKISKSNTGKHSGIKNGMYGKVISDETKNKMSMAQRGKTISLETRMKMSLTRTGIKGKDHPAFGYRHTVEAKKKISDAAKRKKL